MVHAYAYDDECFHDVLNDLWDYVCAYLAKAHQVIFHTVGKKPAA